MIPSNLVGTVELLRVALRARGVPIAKLETDNLWSIQQEPTLCESIRPMPWPFEEERVTVEFYPTMFRFRLDSGERGAIWFPPNITDGPRPREDWVETGRLFSEAMIAQYAGTSDMTRRARAAGIEVVEIR